MRCPRRCLYRFGFQLASNSQDSAYGQMHSSVREVLAWHQTNLEQGSKVDKKEIDEHFEAVWEEHGPQDHALVNQKLGRSNIQQALS
ncbi:MAG: hypothetical protein DWQ07_19080 [Chloroflexi bacterium]|nr:MAG: hypothetical protein DWQ07_19080 [Chloroflexota bacterium]